jgi:hypothetical protein
VKTRLFLSTIVALGLASPRFAEAVVPTSDEMAEARGWVAAKFEDAKDTRQPEADHAAYHAGPFFSFSYDHHGTGTVASSAAAYYGAARATRSA